MLHYQTNFVEYELLWKIEVAIAGTPLRLVWEPTVDRAISPPGLPRAKVIIPVTEIVGVKVPLHDLRARFFASDAPEGRNQMAPRMRMWFTPHPGVYHFLIRWHTEFHLTLCHLFVTGRWRDLSNAAAFQYNYLQSESPATLEPCACFFHQYLQAPCQSRCPMSLHASMSLRPPLTLRGFLMCSRSGIDQNDIEWDALDVDEGGVEF